MLFDGAFLLEPVESEDPSTQPLEVVAAPNSCLLNVSELAPGSHAVVVLTEESRFRVLIKNPLGMVVFDTVVQRPAPPRASRVPPDDETVGTADVLLDVGLYRVECQGSAGTTNAAELLVTDSRD